MKITTREANNLLPLAIDAAAVTANLQTTLNDFIGTAPGGPLDVTDTFITLRASLEALLNALPTETSSGTGAASTTVAGAADFRRRVEEGYNEE